MYNEMRGRRDLAIAYACTGVPTWERRALPLAYPVVTRVIDRYLDITPDTAAQSEAQVRMTFDAVAKRLSDDRPYLCGDRFTAADLTFAALAASVLMPPEYGVPLPQPEELPVAMAAVVREFRAHPGGRACARDVPRRTALKSGSAVDSGTGSSRLMRPCRFTGGSSPWPATVKLDFQ